VFNPSFGSTIFSSLFEPMHPRVAIDLKSQIENTINSQEPRVNLRSVLVTQMVERNGYEITITYTPINETRVVELEFFLQRLR
jgi:phage baseplate assembly protein W